MVFQSEPFNNQSKINSSQFAKGVYFVRIKTDGSAGSPTGNNVVNRKVVIQ